MGQLSTKRNQRLLGVLDKLVEHLLAHRRGLKMFRWEEV
nr:MAG TPA: hypothetical protein [Caudoviricetes sp.]